MAERDHSFAERFDPSRMEDCVTYILNTVRKSGCNGFADEEIYSMAVHFFTEGIKDPGEPVNCQVVANHTVELTEEEKTELREKARMKFFSEELNARKAKSRKPEAPAKDEEPNLFNLFT